MNTDQLYDRLLHATRAAYTGHPRMMSFATLPDDIVRQPITPVHRPCGDVLRRETGLSSKTYPELTDAIIAAGPAAIWRETYKHTKIGAHFLDSFGCYCIAGDGGPFASRHVRLWIVYMPPGLYYPWHHHPAEEIYLVLAGNALFKRQGCPDETLHEGQTTFHQGNQPHAMETFDDPVLCLVAWRNQFQTPPVLTETGSEQPLA